MAQNFCDITISRYLNLKPSQQMQPHHKGQHHLHKLVRIQCMMRLPEKNKKATLVLPNSTYYILIIVNKILPTVEQSQYAN